MENGAVVGKSGQILKIWPTIENPEKTLTFKTRGHLKVSPHVHTNDDYNDNKNDNNDDNKNDNDNGNNHIKTIYSQIKRI